MTYNLTGVDSAANFAEYVKELNIVSEGIMITCILAAFFIILILRYHVVMGTKEVFILSSFLSTLVGILFWALEWISIQILFFPIIILIGSIIAKLFTED